MIDKAVEICQQADILVIIGTSMQVYPAAGLLDFAPTQTPIYYIDPKPAMDKNGKVHIIAESATEGGKTLLHLLENATQN